MKTKLTLMALIFFASILGAVAQTACTDWNGYVNSKNTDGTGYYTLISGFEESASQTYHYSGPGKVSMVRIYGEYPFTSGGVPLRVTIYDVDASGRPTLALQYADITWWWINNFSDFMQVSFGSGVPVNKNFAVGVSIRSGNPFGTSFQLKYTGDGEGLGEDLASLAGTSTGTNWTSAMDNFNRDGDFYLIPEMTHYITSGFDVSFQCAGTSIPLYFSNNSEFSRDNMFNTIGIPGYAGSEYYFSWNFGDGSPVSHDVNPIHSFTAPGVYTVTLTSSIDGWHNNCSDVYTKDISVGLSASTVSVSNVSCFGLNNGSAIALGSGGAPPYLYSLTGFSYKSSPEFNDLTAGVYMLFVKDALECIKTTSFTITEPSPIIVSSASSSNASCGNTDGSILVVASGGTGYLEYRLGSGAYQSSGTFSNLHAGSYMVAIKDANNCSLPIIVNVNNLGAPVLSILSTTNVSCKGGNDGSLVLSASGGTGALQYSINGGTSFQPNGSFLGLEAGTYPALVKDASGCTNGFTVIISEPSAIWFTVESSPVSCYQGMNGKITITSVTGGIGTFSYSIDGSNYQSGNVFEGLTANNYTVYVKDVASCISTETIIITQPQPLVVSVTTTPESCNSSEDGIIVATGLGGSGNYSFSLDGEVFEPSGIFNNLSAGNYTVYILDKYYCSSTVNAIITEPTKIMATLNTTNSTCGNSNGALLATASGGSGAGFQYSLNGVDFNSTGNFSGLSSGTYYILVKDNTECIGIFAATIIDSNGPAITEISHTNVSCNGGSDGTISISGVTGGTGVLQYYIDGVNWQTSPNFSGLTAGVYSVSVKDANHCIGTQTIVLTEPNALTINTATTNASCFSDNSGSVNILASGGAGTLAYSINGGGTFQSNSNFQGLSAGIYSVVIRDGAGCRTSLYFGITQPSEIQVTTGVLNVTCNGAGDGRIVVNGTGGTGNLEYSIDAINFQSSHVFSGLTGGQYAVIARDENGCLKSEVVVVEEPSVLAIFHQSSAVTCHEGNDGVIDLTIAGGTFPYSFFWSNFATSEDVFNLSAGEYMVMVSDANRCQTSHTFTIAEPTEPIVVNGEIINASGNNVANGEIDITVTGGSAPYSYSWSGGEHSEDLTGLVPGVYVVTITDHNGCTTMEFYIVGSSTGIADANDISEHILVYPNPSSSIAIIETNGYIIDALKLMDALGQTVSEIQPLSNKVQLDISILNPGAYFVQLLINNQLIIKKVSIIR